MPGDITVEATGPTGATVNYDPGAGVTCAPSSGTVFPLGVTTVSCTNDADGTAAGSFNVTVQDTTPPTFASAPDVTASTADAGIVVNYANPIASDVNGVSDPVTVQCAPASGSTFPVGTTHVSCTGTDTRGNSATAGFNVIVNDTGNPTISVDQPAPAEATGPSGASVSYTVHASDNSGVAPNVTCAPASGSMFPIGTTPVSCTATDGSGNSASANFSVTVQDTHPPVLTLPADIHTEADSPAGKVVSFSATALDAVAGSVPVNCVPASGSTFGFGTTSVNCSATDGTNIAHGSFSVSVIDNIAPTFTAVPTNRQVEANGPGGSIATYTTPTATDNVDGPIASVNCAPASGSTFPLGTTTVTCSASDSHGNTGHASFTITVRDTTPPTLVVPIARSVYATTPTGIPNYVSGIVSFLSQASAHDIVDPNPIVTNNAPSFIPVGNWTITFGARDASGNWAYQGVTLIILPEPAPGTAPLPVPPAPKPPADVPNLKAVPGNGSVKLTWRAVVGAKDYVVYRSESAVRKTSGEGHGEVVYTGTKTTFTDRGLVNGTEYRYVVVSEDAAGNQSAGVAIIVSPHQDLLRSPKNGASLKKAPTLAWARDAEASYYNAQLTRNGVKILSVWPTGPSYKLQKSWRFEGNRYKLKPGVYQWFVWPGYGPRSQVVYGQMLGSRTFRIVG